MDELKQIETHVADKIVKKYRLNNVSLFSARNKYLAGKNVESFKELRKSEERGREEQDKRKKKEDGKVYIKRAAAYLKGLLPRSIIPSGRSPRTKTYLALANGRPTMRREMMIMENPEQREMQLPREIGGREKWTEGPYAKMSKKFPLSTSPRKKPVCAAI